MSAEGAWEGGSFGERGTCVLAPNPGMMTLDGTNTWVLREPGARRSVVVDPGPSIPSHLDAVAAAAGEVAVVLITHHHLDHTEAALEFAERVNCAVRATDPAQCHRGGAPLVDGEVIEVDGLEVRVLATPGHTRDSVSFHLPAEPAILTGDMVLGRGTTVVAHPDGALAPYLDSIERLRALAASADRMAMWPAHGPVHADGLPVLEFYLEHRRERLDQVRAALEQLVVEPHPEGIADDEVPRRVVEIVYADVPEHLWAPAELSVRAQLDYLRAGSPDR